ncbi:MAG: hemin uptake protein HemP [Burkholderiaceae bacterium]
MIAYEPVLLTDPESVAATGPKGSAGVISSTDLLADRKLIHIQHRGELYSLRETRLGKLILTK